jgi:hypothetical protein
MIFIPPLAHSPSYAVGTESSRVIKRLECEALLFHFVSRCEVRLAIRLCLVYVFKTRCFGKGQSLSPINGCLKVAIFRTTRGRLHAGIFYFVVRKGQSSVSINVNGSPPFRTGSWFVEFYLHQLAFQVRCVSKGQHFRASF